MLIIRGWNLLDSDIRRRRNIDHKRAAVGFAAEIQRDAVPDLECRSRLNRVCQAHVFRFRFGAGGQLPSRPNVSGIHRGEGFGFFR